MDTVSNEALASALEQLEQEEFDQQNMRREQQAADKAAAQAERRQKNKKSVSSFVHPPERHISIDPHELKMVIKNRLELADRVHFDELLKLMEGVANFDFFDLKQRMRNNFLPFSCGARNTTYLQRSSKALPTRDTLDKKEDEFIADVYEVLAASHYTLLTKEEWDLATSENFNLNLPMEVNWDYMDDQLLEKFWDSSPARSAVRTRLPDEMADRILVFHRGIGSARLSGLLIDQKLDLLMDYTVFYLWHLIKGRFTKKASASSAAQARATEQQVMQTERSMSVTSPMPNFHIYDSLPESLQNAIASVVKLVASATGSADSTRATTPDGLAPVQAGPSVTGAKAVNRARRFQQCPTMALPEGSAMARYEYQDGAMIASHHRFAKVVERQTLERQCPTLLTLLKAFPCKMSLQEPTFKDLVVVYRRAMPPRKPPTASANAPNKTKEERLQSILQYRNIHIKVFGETPMADVEIIFPDKVVGIKPFQLVNLMVTLVTALVMGALVLWKATNINVNILWTAASLVLTRCFAVYTTAQTQRTMLQQKMTSSLYDKMQDSQEGVISVITEELADQQLKQMLLAYMMLLIKQRAMLPQDLDNACEDFLMKEFDHAIDYDLESALPRLESWGLVLENNQGKLQALPMTEAITLLQQAWAIAYKEVGKEGPDKVPTIEMITGSYSVFKEGIKKNKAAFEKEVQEREEAARKSSSIMGKAKNVFSSSSKGSSGGGVPPNGLDAYGPTASYSAGGAPASMQPDIAAADGSDRGSAGGSGGGTGLERKKSGSLRGMLRKLKS